MHIAVGPFGDVDNTPYKTLIFSQRDQPGMRRFFELGFAKRPEHELYHLASDPDQVTNVATDPKYREVIKELHARVESRMQRTADPRAIEPQSSVFDRYKYYGSAPRPERLTPRKAFVL